MDRRLTWAVVLAAACFALGWWVGHLRGLRPAPSHVGPVASRRVPTEDEAAPAGPERLPPPTLEGPGRRAPPAPRSEQAVGPAPVPIPTAAPLPTAPPPDVWDEIKAGTRKLAEESLLPSTGAGTLRVTADDGTVRIDVGYAAGRFHGPWTSRHADGRLHAEGEYAEGRKVGTWRTYHANGQIASEATLGESGEEGLVRTWRADGTQEGETSYEGGKAHGRHRRWHADGRGVAEDGTFAEGARDGRWTWFDGDGRVVREEDWRGGALSGPVRLLALPADALSETDALVQATQDGKYSDLLKRIAAPDDRAAYGAVNDYGHCGELDYLGEQDIPAGWWVYVVPYWYVWGQARGVER